MNEYQIMQKATALHQALLKFLDVRVQKKQIKAIQKFHRQEEYSEALNKVADGIINQAADVLAKARLEKVVTINDLENMRNNLHSFKR